MTGIRAGVIGCGQIAQIRHIPALIRMRKKVELAAVCDMNENLARKTASDFHIPHSYDNLTDMLSREKLDMLDVCVPPQVHGQVAQEAIEMGCHVIMEKPMALKTSDCDAMIASARKKGTSLCVIHNDLFHPPFLRARRMVAEGRIGDFVGMRIFLSTPHWDMIDLEKHWYHKLPGGVIGETGPHFAYMSLAFLDKVNDLDVFALSRLALPWAPYDEFRIELVGDSAISSVALSYTRNSWSALVDLFGTESTLHIDLNKMTVTEHRLSELKCGPIARLSVKNIGQLSCDFTRNGAMAALGKLKLGTDYVIERYVDGLLKGIEPPVTGEEGRRSVQLMERVVSRYVTKYGTRQS